MVLKPANKYQIICQYYSFNSILIDDFQYHSFLYGETPLSTALKITNCQGETTIQTVIYCLIYSGARKAFRKIMQHMFHKLGFHYGLT